MHCWTDLLMGGLGAFLVDSLLSGLEVCLELHCLSQWSLGVGFFA